MIQIELWFHALLEFLINTNLKLQEIFIHDHTENAPFSVPGNLTRSWNGGLGMNLL